MTRWIAPFRSESLSPPGPSATPAIAASSTSIVTTMSLRAASSATDCATCAPAAAERRGLRRERVEYREVVPCLEQAAGHPLSHSAEADETYFHDLPQRKRAWATLSAAVAGCKP